MPKNTGFSSAYRPGITPAEVLAFHKARFGDLRMEDEGGEGEPAGSDDDAQEQQPGDKGFPANTPLAEMTPEQQAAYWKDKARKHEGTVKDRADYDALKAKAARLDELERAGETDTDKAIREAREAGAADAIKTSFDKTAKALLRMGLRSANVEDKDIDEIVEQANLSAFADEDGDVDDEKVARYIKRNAGTASSTPKWPATGQGNRGSAPKESGQDLYARLHGKK